jgi:MerR family transcriptional regulator, Zn(II)-responsive regulator of zntA
LKDEVCIVKRIQIGAVAKRTGLSIDAIRFYEKQGLLKSPSRSNGGFRLFHEDDIGNLEFIRSAQTLGFSLEEIRDLLSLRIGAPEPCAEVERLLSMKLSQIQLKIAGLESLESELRVALRQCRRTLRLQQSNSDASCPVLVQIAQGRRRGKKR